MIVRIKWKPIPGVKLRKRTAPLPAYPAWRLPRPGVALAIMLLAPAMQICTVADVPPPSPARPVIVQENAPLLTLAAFMREHHFASPYHLPNDALPFFHPNGLFVSVLKCLPPELS